MLVSGRVNISHKSVPFSKIGAFFQLENFANFLLVPSGPKIFALQAARCSLDAQTLDLETPLHLALRGGHLEAPGRFEILSDQCLENSVGWLRLKKTLRISGSKDDPFFIHLKYRYRNKYTSTVKGVPNGS